MDFLLSTAFLNYRKSIEVRLHTVVILIYFKARKEKNLCYHMCLKQYTMFSTHGKSTNQFIKWLSDVKCASSMLLEMTLYAQKELCSQQFVPFFSLPDFTTSWF